MNGDCQIGVFNEEKVTNHKINEIIGCIKKLKGNIKQTRMNFKIGQLIL